MTSPTFFPVGEVGGLLGGLGVVLGRLGNPSPRRPSLAIRGGPHRPPKGRDGDAFARPSPDWPPTPPLPHRPIEAFGREASPPLPTGHLLATPGTPPLPRLSGSGGLRDGVGFFRVLRGAIRGGPCALHPLWGPPPHRLTDWPLPATYGQRGLPSLATKGRGRLCPATPPGRGRPLHTPAAANCKVYPQFRVYA